MGYVGNQTTNSYSSLAKQTITGDGGTSYTLDHAVANAQEVEIFVNNVRQEPGVAYTVNGTALTMTGNVAASDDFYVVFQGKALQTVTPPDLSVTTAKIVDANVTTAKIADDAVTLAKANDDFYKTGTWTPSFTSSGGGSATMGSNTSGHYVRVGNVVYVHANLEMTTNSLSSGQLRVSGLPYTPSGTDGYFNSTAFFTYTVNVAPQPFAGTFADGEAYISVWKQGNNQSYQATDFDDGGRAVVSGFYFTL